MKKGMKVRLDKFRLGMEGGRKRGIIEFKQQLKILYIFGREGGRERGVEEEERH